MPEIEQLTSDIRLISAAQRETLEDRGYTTDYTCPEHGGGLADCEWIHELRWQVITNQFNPFAIVPQPDDEPF